MNQQQIQRMNANWACSKCTFINNGTSIYCTICNEHKPRTISPAAINVGPSGCNNVGPSKCNNVGPNRSWISHNDKDKSSSNSHQIRRGRTRERRHGVANIMHRNRTTSSNRAPLTANNLQSFDATNELLAAQRSHSVPSKARSTASVIAHAQVPNLPSKLNEKSLNRFNKINDYRASTKYQSIATPYSRTNSAYPSMDTNRKNEVKSNLFRINSEACKWKSENNPKRNRRRQFQKAMDHESCRRERERNSCNARKEQRKIDLEKQRKRALQQNIVIGDNVLVVSKEWKELLNGERIVAFMIYCYGLSPQQLFNSFPCDINYKIMKEKKYDINEMIWDATIWGISRKPGSQYQGYIYLPCPDRMNIHNFKNQINKLKVPFVSAKSRRSNIFGPFWLNKNPGFILKLSRSNGKTVKQNLIEFKRLFPQMIVVGNTHNYENVLNGKFEQELDKRYKLIIGVNNVKEMMKDTYNVALPESRHHFKGQFLNEAQLNRLRAIFNRLLRIIYE